MPGLTSEEMTTGRPPSFPQPVLAKIVSHLREEEASHEIDEVARVCAGIVDVTDFFVVDEISDRRKFGSFDVERGLERGVGG